VTKEV